MHIQWIADDNIDSIYISQEMMDLYKIAFEDIVLHFGAWKKQVSIKVYQLPTNTIGLPQSFKHIFTIPNALPYEIFLEGNNLHIGPVIAFVPFQNHREITLQKLNKYRPYFQNYDVIKGLIYICAVDRINIKDKTIEGFYYDPSAKEGESVWKHGIFPYPGAVYRRAVIPEEKYHDLILTIGAKVFNDYSPAPFSKWKLWNWLSPHPSLRKHLPQTKVLDNLKTLDDMLSHHGSVYLKPTEGTLSAGVLKVVNSKSGYLFIYPNRKKEGKGTVKKIIKNRKAVSKRIKSLAAKGYIVQQAIPMKRYKNRAIDFRVIMQKNGENRWNCAGVVGKFGKRHGIITRIVPSGFALPGVDAFKAAFQMNEQEASGKVQELMDISFEICKIFDAHGNYGDLGMDLMVDREGKTWIIEVNAVDPYHTFPLLIKNKQMYNKVVTAPFEYAKYLTGFIKPSN